MRVDCNRSDPADERQPNTRVSGVKRGGQFSVQMCTSALRARKLWGDSRFPDSCRNCSRNTLPAWRTWSTCI